MIPKQKEKCRDRCGICQMEDEVKVDGKVEKVKVYVCPKCFRPMTLEEVNNE